MKRAELTGGFLGIASPEPKPRKVLAPKEDVVPTPAPSPKQLQTLNCSKCGAQVNRLTGYCHTCNAQVTVANAWAQKWPQEKPASSDPKKLLEVMRIAARSHTGFMWAEVMESASECITHLLERWPEYNADH